MLLRVQMCGLYIEGFVLLFENHQISTDGSILSYADITNLFLLLLLLLLPLQCVSDPGAVFLRLPL